MTTYTQPTGAAGTMRIDDDGVEYVEFWLLGVNHLVDQIPWAYIANGETSTWRSFRLEANVSWQKVTTLRVTTPQDVTFRLGASGDAAVGGPTDFVLAIPRATVEVGGTGAVRVKMGDIYYTAIPYVKDDGVWKQAQPWGRVAGEWGVAN